MKQFLRPSLLDCTFTTTMTFKWEDREHLKIWKFSFWMMFTKFWNLHARKKLLAFLVSCMWPNSYLKKLFKTKTKKIFSQSFGSCMMGSCGGSLSDCSQVPSSQKPLSSSSPSSSSPSPSWHNLHHHSHHYQELQHCASGPVISLGFSVISIVIGVIQVFD